MPETASGADWIEYAGLQFCMAVVFVSFLVVSARNIISTLQLVLAAVAFRTRIKPAARGQDLWGRYSDLAMPVAVIAPCFNEELTVADSTRALLGLHYPEYEVLVVNDGSQDGTLARLIGEFELYAIEREQLAVLQKTAIKAVYASATHPQLTVIDKENGRKADAVNAGIGFATAPLVCVIDGDSIIEADGLLRATEPFMGDDGTMVAVGGAIRIANGSLVRGGYIDEVRLPAGWLPRFQILEYLRAFLTARVANAHFNMLLLISGAFGIFRRDTLIEAGGYRHDTVGEDLEIVTRIHRFMRENGREYRIGFVPEVVCWTEAPATWGGLRNQRSRWEQGALETLVRHRRMLFNPRYGRIGLLALPVVVLEDVIGPPAELAGYLIIPLLLALGLLDGDVAFAFLCLTFVFGTALSLGTLVLEEWQLRRTPKASDLLRLGLAAIYENFGYRQANLVFRLLGVWRFLRKDTAWAGVPRAGFTQSPKA